MQATPGDAAGASPSPAAAAAAAAIALDSRPSVGGSTSPMQPQSPQPQQPHTPSMSVYPVLGAALSQVLEDMESPMPCMLEQPDSSGRKGGAPEGFCRQSSMYDTPFAAGDLLDEALETMCWATSPRPGSFSEGTPRTAAATAPDAAAADVAAADGAGDGAGAGGAAGGNGRSGDGAAAAPAGSLVAELPPRASSGRFTPAGTPLPPRATSAAAGSSGAGLSGGPKLSRRLTMLKSVRSAGPALPPAATLRQMESQNGWRELQGEWWANLWGFPRQSCGGYQDDHNENPGLAHGDCGMQWPQPWPNYI